MLVIHGIWAYGAAYLWAEDSALSQVAAPRSGRPSRAPRPHPFAAACASLADALTDLPGPPADLIPKAADDELTLWLPSKASGPLPSPDLIPTPGLEVAGASALTEPQHPGEAGSGGSAGPGAGAVVASSGLAEP